MPKKRKTMGTDSTKPIQETKDSRTICWALVVISIIAIVISGYALAKRISVYNDTTDHSLFAYIEVVSSSFTFADKPVTLVEDTVDDKPVIRVGYGDVELVLDVAIESKVPLPTLFDRQKDWMTMVFFADRSGMTLAEFDQKIRTDEIRPRLALITRTPFGIEPPKEPRFENIGHDENQSTGDVHREQWRFDCYEFLRDGTTNHEVKRFPESGKSLLRRQNYAKLNGEPIPQRSEGELEEYTWQYGAALKTMPRAPAITFEKQALRNAGWTLPVAAGGFLLLIISFFFAIAPPRTTEL